MGYRLSDKSFRAKMRRADVDSLADEIRIGKVLLEEKINACNEQQRTELLPLFMAALTQLDKLVSDYRRFEEASSRTLTKTNAHNLARKMADCVTRHIRGKFPEWEGAIDAINKDLAAEIQDAKNEIEEK